MNELIYFYQQIKKQSADSVVNLVSCFNEGQVCVVITEHAVNFASLEDQGAFSEDRCIKLNQELNKILNKMHAHGLFVCDLRPSKILYNYDTQRIKLFDFKNSFREGYTAYESVVYRGITGPAELCCPEQISSGMGGDPSKARDVDMWQKANVVYYCFYGEHAVHSLEDVKSAEVPDKEISEEFGSLLLEMLDRNVENRPHRR